jgi:hypothetical protein
MAKHLATQEQNPGRTTWRTIIQVAPSAIIGLVILLPLIIEEVLNGFGEQMPESMRLWLLGAAAFITALSATLARIMAIPAVNDWFRKHFKPAAPDHQEAVPANPDEGASS